MNKKNQGYNQGVRCSYGRFFYRLILHFHLFNDNMLAHCLQNKLLDISTISTTLQGKNKIMDPNETNKHSLRTEDYG